VTAADVGALYQTPEGKNFVWKSFFPSHLDMFVVDKILYCEDVKRLRM
jgi:hypothetical protein